MKTVIFVLTVIFTTVTVTKAQCRCPEGYTPQRISGREYMCAGIRTRDLKPCNEAVPSPPTCVCKNDANSIITDSSGTWCVIMKRGEEAARWQCENWREREGLLPSNPSYSSPSIPSYSRL
ncbi:hypothetical protein PPYR_13663 [Photinus pyralis]|uniref:Thyroglobulin type-1 domain-containing protein n=2 Tax=Photinus pyralis TaxID=7054 RepID=A0A5N4A9P9_PHOPY|nr:hypothetical protein PPYR_13663 [Photinus pyralis]